MAIRKTYNLPVAPQRGASGILTMDASAVSSGLAFLESELEKLDPMLRSRSRLLLIPGTLRLKAAAAGSRLPPHSM